MPAVFGFAATILPVLVVNHGWGVWPAVARRHRRPRSLVGVVNGFLVVKLGVNTIVVTLGMSTLLEGISLWMSDVNTISGLPAGVRQASPTKDVGGLPIDFYYGVVLVLVFAYLLAFTPLGRHMRFVGRQPGGQPAVRRPGGPDPVRLVRLRGPAVRRRRGHRGRRPRRLRRDHAPTATCCRCSPRSSSAPRSSSPAGSTRSARFVGIYFLETGILGLQLLGLQAWVSAGLLRRRPGDRGDDLHPAAPSKFVAAPDPEATLDRCPAWQRSKVLSVFGLFWRIGANRET